MTAEPVIPFEIQQLAQYMYESQMGVMINALAELAALTKPARNVRDVPAQRWAGETLLLTTGNKSNYQVLGRRPDAKRLRIAYIGATAGTEIDVIRVGHSLSLVTAATYSACRVLNANARELVLEVNDADVWIALGANAAVGGELVSWTVEEYDPNAIG